MINWTQINTLRAETGADGFDEIIELFMQEMQQAIDGLTPRNDRIRLEADLHFIKGSAATLGFHALADVCQSGEIAAAKGWADAVDLDAIVQAFYASKTMFTEHISHRLTG